MANFKKDWLPDYIEIAQLNEVTTQVTDVWNNLFVPHCLKNKELFFPFDDWELIEIGLSSYALASAVENALIDICRWSSFHLSVPPDGEMARPDRHKYAGFLAKWIAKERPIYVRPLDYDNPVEIPAEMYRLNSFFALLVIQSYLDKPMSLKIANELAYLLHFRDEKGETLAILAYCGEEIGIPTNESIEIATKPEIITSNLLHLATSCT